MRSTSRALSFLAALLVLAVLVPLAAGCGSRCAVQHASFVLTGSTCCPARAGVIWNGLTCVQPHDCGCWTCEGPSCGDTYPDLASCARAHESCVR